MRLFEICFLRMISKQFNSSRPIFINFIDLQFLTKNCEERLGCTASGEQSIMDQAYFREMDWVKLEARQIEPPFKPIIVRKTMQLTVSCVIINYSFFCLFIYLLLLFLVLQAKIA